MSPDGQVLEEGFCDPSIRPAESERCILFNCIGENFFLFCIHVTRLL